MEMHQVRYFLAVARTLNFTRAADECNVTQPSLTRAIQKLEEEFGGLLFRRERARTHLTDLGREMLPHLARTYEAAQAAKAVAKGIGKAEIAPLNLGLAGSIRAPQLTAVLQEIGDSLSGLELSIEGGASAALIDRALDGALDLIIVERPPEVHDRLEEWPLYSLPYLVLVSARHRLVGADPLRLADLEGESWIETAHDCTARFRAACERAGFSPRFRHKADDEVQLQRLVAAGLGAGLVPAGTQLMEGLSARLVEDGDWAGEVVLATVGGRRRSPATDAFIRSARARSWPGDQSVGPSQSRLRAS